MPPLGAWTSTSSVTAVDSDLESSFLSLTFDVNYDGTRSIPSIMASSMADGHTISENMAPRTADWVQQQSAHDQPPARAMAAHHAPPPVTPPPRGDPAFQRRGTQVYDISALLEMRNTQCTAQSTVNIMQRVKSEALGENIFRYLQPHGSRVLPNRSRGLSDISNVSRGSINSNSNITQYPSATSKYANGTKVTSSLREPLAPPDNPLLQRHDGFRRFLVQHASPPHHRVTAGGRIVPAGPLSPPPMLDFGSLNGLLRQRPATAESLQNQGRSDLKPQDSSVHTTPLNFDGFPAVNMTGQFSASSVQAAVPLNNAPYGYQPFLTPEMQTPAALVSIGNFQDGSTLVSCNGVNCRAYWNGTQTVLEPIATIQLQSSVLYPHAPPDVSQYNVPSQPTQPPNPLFPVVGTTNYSRPFTRKPNSSSQGLPSGNQENLKTELFELDKYLALYHYEIEPAHRAACVARRRYLVEALDKIRVGKEQTNRSIPIIAPGTGLPITPIARHSLYDKTGPSTPFGAQGTSYQRVPSNETTNSKGLSPSAMPFVPRGVQSVSSVVSGMRNISGLGPQETLNVSKRRVSHEASFNVKDMASTAMARKDKALSTFDPSGSTQVISHREDSSSSVLDPSDPAMRVILYEDIEYAGRYLYNWDQDKKIYCTTVAEFQEAIRRVRDQARRFGCLGGQSKDPAYDAEQDLYWAILDRDPIPLPTKVPDYFTNPRPWNWNDSAFNFRVQGAPSPGSGPANARNSPRLMGWDAAMTEFMKDNMDVSRCYYALKGQLPSVPFRTWAFDREGKKIDIEVKNAESSANGCVPSRYATDIHSSIDTMEEPVQDDAAVRVSSRALRHSRAPRALSTSNLNSRPTGTRNRKTNITEDNLNTSGPGPKAVRGTGDVNPALAAHSAEVRRFVSDLKAQAHHDSHFEDRPVTPAAHQALSLADKALTPKLDPMCASRAVGMEPPGLQANGNGVTLGRTPSPSTSYTVDMEPDLNINDSEAILDTAYDETWEGQYPIYDSRNPNYSKFHLKDSQHPLDSGDVRAETRSQWGPEEGSGSIEPNVPAHPLFDANVNTTGKAKAAKVNIPTTPSLDSSIRKVHENYDTELKSDTIPRIENAGSHKFLRKMLKSPTFLSFQGFKQPRGMESVMVDRANKEKSMSNDKLRPTGSGTISKDRQSAPGSTFKSDPNLSVSKAQSSLASSAYQAQGYLPPVIGAGNAASMYNHQNNVPTVPQVQANMPSSTSHDGPHATSIMPSDLSHVSPSQDDALAARLRAIDFGFDGGADWKSPHDNNASPKATQTGHPNFDYMGVTTADYEVKRENHDNGWHKGAIEDFFQELRETERKEVASKRGTNIKGGS